jgi:hypothetical protein
MKNNIFAMLILAGFGMIFLAACSSISVITDYDNTVDFTKYKTFEYYGWAKESDQILNDFDKRRIEEAFGNELKSRGLELVESGGDLVVSLFIVVQEKTEQRATTSHSGMGYGGYYGDFYGYGPGWGAGPGFSTTTVREYDYNVGTLVIDVFDKAEERLIWESIGKGTVDDDPSSRDKNIPKAVKQIMKDYPVPPIKE